MSIIDVKLTQRDDRIYDLSISENGDLTIDESFDTPIIVSLFSDGRADESEVARPEFRRGYWPYDEGEFGSKLWLLARRTQRNLNRARDFSFQALEWLVDDGYLQNIQTSSSYIAGGFRIRINLVRKNNEIEVLYYDAWEQSEFN